MDDKQTSVYGFLKNPSMVDFEGHLAGVFFTSGCNFRCGFCQNAQLLGRKQQGITWQRLHEACGEFREKWATAVVITGGEPTIAPDIPEIIDFFQKQGFSVKLDTNGSQPKTLEHVLPLVDYVAQDIKCSPSKYPEFVGFNEPERVKDSIELLKTSGTPYEFRTTLVESYHTDDELCRIGETVRGAQLYFVQPFLPREDLPDPGLREEPRTSPARLREAADLMSNYVQDVRIHGKL